MNEVPYSVLRKVTKAATDWIGANPMDRSRSAPCVSARRYVIQELAAKGYSESAIARSLRMHPSSVHFHQRKLT